MPIYEDTIQRHCDNRMGMLGKIKARSLGADVLTLTALRVLVYAQLEGGIKDLASCLIKHINDRHLSFNDIRPGLLKWRNSTDLERFRAALDFDAITSAAPFTALLTKRVKIKSINRRYEMNQMDWSAVKSIYQGFGLSTAFAEQSKAQIDEIVSERNAAAHYGQSPSIAAGLLESQLRTSVGVVETVLMDMSIQMLEFFATGMHKR